MDQHARKSGFERPFHPFQVISWVIQPLNIFAVFFITLPCLSENNRVIIGSVYSLIQFLVFLFGFKLTKSDPSDNTVEAFRKAQKDQANEIEDKNEKFCNFCKSPVFYNSKHCVRCNRCTRNFDHHCKWVNNCVGENNYKTFIVLILSCLALEVLLTVISSYVLILSVYKVDELSERIRNYYNRSFSFKIFIVVEAALGIEGIVFTCLLGYLVGLHVYLRIRGLTTYDFILLRRNKHQIIPTKEVNNSVEDNKCLEKCSMNASPMFKYEPGLDYRM